MPKKCIVCHERKPEVPDRNVQGRPIKKLCKHCHRERLIGDLKNIHAIHKKGLTNEKK